MVWFRFFLGTPRRFVATMVAIGVVVVIAFPGLLEMAVRRFVCALMPLLGPAMIVLIVFAGLRMIVRGGR
jgi:hypothetical protein